MARRNGVEQDFTPTTVADLVELRRAVLDAGWSDAVANGLIGWLVGRSTGGVDTSGAPTSARYRRILRQVHSLGRHGHARRNVPDRREEPRPA